MRRKDPQLMEKLKETAEQLYIAKLRQPSVAEIAAACGVVKSTVQKYFVEMDRLGMLSYKDGVLMTEKIARVNRETVSVGVLGPVSCGVPQLEEGQVEQYMALPVSLFGKGEYYMLHANGESMVDAGIDDGDAVIIRKQSQAKEGDIVVALVDGSSNTLKRFYPMEDGSVRLHPENAAMEDIITRDCAVQGVAVSVIKALN